MFTLNIGPLTFLVKLDLITVGKHHLVRGIEQLGVFLGKSHFLRCEMLLDKLLCNGRKLLDCDRFIVVG